MIRVLIISALFIVGCQKTSKSTPAEIEAVTAQKIAKKDVSSGLKTPAKAKAKKQHAKPKKKRAAKSIKWTDSLTWHSWSKAQELSAETGRPIMLMVYANWCPRCRELAPVFQDPKVIAAAQKLILVRQDQDERPDWLSQYRQLGGYVPRVIFFGNDGQPRTDINNGRSKYPYFYTPRGAATLAKSMAKASTQ